MKEVLHITCLFVGATLAVIILFGRTVTAQEINKAEYFFDSDPGIGKGTAITVSTPADSIDISSSASTSGLTQGFHSLFVRVENTGGRWSLYGGENFYLYTDPVQAQSRINAAEYFFDVDPGIGKGAAIPVNQAADSIDILSTISTTGLAPGFHGLFVRARDSVGTWSLYEARNFYLYPDQLQAQSRINAAEYFFDVDPGIGKGTSATVSKAGDSVDISSGISLAGLTKGFHSLFVRVKDSVGAWSLYEGRNFYIENSFASSSPQLARAEVFFDTDPGFGKGIAVSPSFAPADSVDLFRHMSASGLALGGHNMFVRVRTDSGLWSMALNDTFTVVQHCTGIDVSGSNSQVCVGDSATLTATGGTAYYWWPTNDTTRAIKVSPTTTDTFFVQVNNTGCASDSDFVLTVNPLPTISITDNGAALTASGGTSYVWSTKSTNDTIDVHKTGRYSVTGTDAAGCSDTASYYVVVTGIGGVSGSLNKVSLYPNPNNGEFSLSYNLTSSNAQLRIIDIMGRTIYEENLTGTEGAKQIEPPGLNNGLFFWQIVYGNQIDAQDKMTVIK